MKKEVGLSRTLWYIVISAVVISVVIYIISLFITSAPLKFALGLFYGTAVSILRVVMLARSVNISVDMDAEASKKYMLSQYHLRMLITIAALVFAAAIRERISIIGLVIGLLVMQPAVYVANVIYEMKGGEKVEGISTKKTNRDS